MEAIYIFLFAVFRIAGKRTLSQATSFDLVLLLIISEVTQQAMVDSDLSITNSFVLILTLVGITILLAYLKQRIPRLERIIDDVPLLLVDNGRQIHRHMDRERVDERDILEAARMQHGLERMEQIKYAVLERNGAISIIPLEKGELGFRPAMGTPYEAAVR
jgi:uncharacterized membrane protein YcaP (DUF421 family)